jgi:uncharacterized protein YnzC (UPF0291/DUF896 family)
MAHMVANTDNLILSRLVVPGGDERSRRAAEGLLSIRFMPQDVARMNELAELARERPLTPDERQEMESYNRIGHFLALIHSKARLALKTAEGAAGD